MWWSVFPSCDKISEKNNLKEEGFILAYNFRGISLVTWSCQCGPVARSGKVWWNKDLYLMTARSKKERESKGPGARYTFQTRIFFQLVSIF
jgi:hypothetical protein